MVETKVWVVDGPVAPGDVTRALETPPVPGVARQVVPQYLHCISGQAG